MKKVVLATILTCAVASFLPLASAQDAPPAAQPAPAADPCAVPPMAAPEYTAYNSAITQTDPKAQAAGLEQYLTQFPQTAVKKDTLQRLVLLYSGFDIAKTLDASDRLLQVDPNNPYALFFEALIRKNQSDAITDATAKQAALDSAAGYAQKGLAATKPKCLADSDYTKLSANATPTFYSVIGNDAFGKKDSATAIDNFKKELTSVPLDQTKQPGPPLLDTFFLAEAYVQSTPPDYLNCSFYASRVIAYAPDAFKQQAAVAALPKYCYHKYHGPDDNGYDAVLAAATANLNPPDGFAASVKPAPTPADIVNQVIASTPDLSTLAVGDKEYILQNGTPDQAAKMWNLLKGKAFQIQGTVVSATPTELQLSVSDDAVQSKTTDYTIKLTPALTLLRSPSQPLPLHKSWPTKRPSQPRRSKPTILPPQPRWAVPLRRAGPMTRSPRTQS